MMTIVFQICCCVVTVVAMLTNHDLMVIASFCLLIFGFMVGIVEDQKTSKIAEKSGVEELAEGLSAMWQKALEKGKAEKDLN